MIVNLIVDGIFSKVSTRSSPRGDYAIVNFLKRSEGVDTFDYKTHFSPFIAKM